MEEKQLKELIDQILKQSSDSFPQLSEDTLATIYAFGCNFYDNGKYREASDFFRFLTYADAFNRKYWMALAATYQMQKKYKEAIEYYSVAAVQNPEDPYAHFYAADCFLALGQVDQAKIALDSAEKTAKLTDNHANLLSHVALIQAAWSDENLKEKAHEPS